MVHPEIRNSIPHKEIEPAKVLSESIQDGTHDEKANVTRDDELSILSLVKRA